MGARAGADQITQMQRVLRSRCGAIAGAPARAWASPAIARTGPDQRGARPMSGWCLTRVSQSGAEAPGTAGWPLHGAHRGPRHGSQPPVGTRADAPPARSAGATCANADPARWHGPRPGPQQLDRAAWTGATAHAVGGAQADRPIASATAQRPAGGTAWSAMTSETSSRSTVVLVPSAPGPVPGEGRRREHYFGYSCPTPGQRPGPGARRERMITRQAPGRGQASGAAPTTLEGGSA